MFYYRLHDPQLHGSTAGQLVVSDVEMAPELGYVELTPIEYQREIAKAQRHGQEVAATMTLASEAQAAQRAEAVDRVAAALAAAGVELTVDDLRAAIG